MEHVDGTKHCWLAGRKSIWLEWSG